METEKNNPFKGSLTGQLFSTAFYFIFFIDHNIRTHMVQVNDVKVLDTILPPLWCEAISTWISHNSIIILISHIRPWICPLQIFLSALSQLQGLACHLTCERILNALILFF